MIFYVVELLDDWNVDVLSWKYPRNLESPRVSSPGFGNDSKMMVMFSLQSDSRRTLIWRAPGIRYDQENTIERHRYGGAGWSVWGGIILGSRTDLHVQSVTMTGHIYRDVILEQHVRLFRGAMGAEFLFMDDNARPLRANIVDECLQSDDITRMDWRAYSPDLNPIEHVWDMLGRRIAARQPPPTYLPELRRALLDERCNIPQDLIDNLIPSMPKRSTRGLLVTDLIILDNGQVSRTTSELAPLLSYQTTPTGGRLRLKFNVHQPPLHGGTLALLRNLRHIAARTHDTPDMSPLP
ncbi:transposable element Tcb2 transposase [Trichonephila clavipes]|nr:transposable element Tcb2 transposase [Trichonephila clavipes]